MPFTNLSEAILGLCKLMLAFLRESMILEAYHDNFDSEIVEGRMGWRRIRPRGGEAWELLPPPVAATAPPFGAAFVADFLVHSHLKSSPVHILSPLWYSTPPTT